MLQEIISEPWLFCFSVFQVWNQSSVTQVCVHIKEILWSVINNGSGVQFLSVIIQAVFDKVKQPCSGSPIYLIMRMITGQMRWHKVLFIINKKFVIIKAFFILPLLIKEVNHLAQWFCGVQWSWADQLFSSAFRFDADKS